MKPLLTQLLIAATLTALGWWSADRYYLGPERATLDRRESRVAELRAKNDATDKFRLEKERLEQDLAAAKSRLAEIQSILPAASNPADFLDELRRDARDSNLTLVRFDDTHPARKVGLNESPVRIETAGRFPDQLSFLKTLAEKHELIVFRDQRLETKDQSTTAMTLSVAVPIDLPDEEAVKKADAK